MSVCNQKHVFHSIGFVCYWPHKKCFPLTCVFQRIELQKARKKFTVKTKGALTKTASSDIFRF